MTTFIPCGGHQQMNLPLTHSGKYVRLTPNQQHGHVCEQGDEDCTNTPTYACHTHDGDFAICTRHVCDQTLRNIDALEAIVDASFRELGMTWEEAVRSDDPETRELPACIRITLQHERDKLEEATNAIKQLRTQLQRANAAIAELETLAAGRL